MKKQEYLEKLYKMDNEELFDEYTELLTDVDNDAVRSNITEWKLSKVSVELNQRLVKCGFLTKHNEQI